MKRLLALVVLCSAALLAQPPSSNARRLQSRPICSTAPSDTNLLGWSAASGCWTPTAAGTAMTYPVAGVPVSVAGTSWRGTAAASTDLSDTATIGKTPASVTTTFSATPTFTCPSANGTIINFGLSTALTANITSSTLASCPTGALLNFRMCQDGTGGRTVAWPTGFTEAVAPSPIASACTKQTFYWDGAAARLLSATVDAGPGVIVTQAAPAGNPVAGSIFEWWDSTDYTLKTKDPSANVYVQTKAAASRTANQFVTHVPSTGIPATAAIAATDLPATPLPTPGDTISLSAPRGYAFCTTTCTVTLPTPAAGYEFCIRNADNVATVITLANITDVAFEATARTGYYSTNRKLVSGGVVTDQICLVGYDATKYAVMSSTGTWTDTAP